jgi:hypothetical protein
MPLPRVSLLIGNNDHSGRRSKIDETRQGVDVIWLAPNCCEWLSIFVVVGVSSFRRREYIIIGHGMRTWWRKTVSDTAFQSYTTGMMLIESTIWYSAIINITSGGQTHCCMVVRL